MSATNVCGGISTDTALVNPRRGRKGSSLSDAVAARIQARTWPSLIWYTSAQQGGREMGNRVIATRSMLAHPVNCVR